MPNKIIHQIIGKKKNDLIYACLFSWNSITNYGFRIVLWDDEKIEIFLRNNYSFALEAFLKARNYAEAADIARYLIIYHFGGYYIDWDIQLLDAKYFVSLSEEYSNGFLVIDPINNTLASECFSSNVKEPYLLSLTKDIIEIFNNNLRNSMFTPQFSGPYRMRDSLYKHNNSEQSLIPVDDIFLYNYREIRFKPFKCYTRPLIHYWVHNWIK